MDWIFLIVSFTMIIIFVFSFAKGKAPLRYLFYMWIFSFHIGPRAVDPMGISIFFCEGLTWLLFFLYLFRSNFYVGYRKLLPPFTSFLFIIFLLGVIIAVVNGKEQERIILELKPFLLLLPCFYITRFAFRFLDVKFSTIINIFAIGGLILALGGVGIYFFPSLRGLAVVGSAEEGSVLIDTTETAVALGDKTLLRGGGSFWGRLIIAGYLALLLLPIFTRGAMFRNRLKKIFFFLICGLMVVNIIINGHRSVWALLLVGIALFGYMKGAKNLFRAAIVLSILIAFVPEEVYLRFLTISDQSTWAGRVGRYQSALRIMFDNILFGAGWGAVGWTHNFILQVGANLGLTGLFVLIIWLVKLFRVSLGVYKNNQHPESLHSYHLSFLIGWLIFMGPMLGETVITLPFMMAPFWFFSAVLYNFYTGTIGGPVGRDRE
jgi:hypothetical protein